MYTFTLVSILCSALVTLCQSQAVYKSSPFGKNYHVTNAAMEFNAAEATCSAIGGTLVRIESRAEQLWVRQEIGIGNQFWIGGKSNNGNSTTDTYFGRLMTPSFKWFDGSTIGWSNWFISEPNCQEECCAIWVDTDDTWNDLECTTQEKPVVCQKLESEMDQVNQTLTKLSNHQEVVYEPSPFGKNYYYKSSKMNFNGAQAVCSAIGGTLVRIESRAEQDYVRYNVAMDTDIWLGSSANTNGLIATNSSFKWTNGSTIRWSNWYREEPDCNSDCCAIWLDTSDNSWNDDLCDTSYHRFVCQKLDPYQRTDSSNSTLDMSNSSSNENHTMIDSIGDNLEFEDGTTLRTNLSLLSLVSEQQSVTIRRLMDIIQQLCAHEVEQKSRIDQLSKVIEQVNTLLAMRGN